MKRINKSARFNTACSLAVLCGISILALVATIYCLVGIFPVTSLFGIAITPWLLVPIILVLAGAGWGLLQLLRLKFTNAFGPYRVKFFVRGLAWLIAGILLTNDPIKRLLFPPNPRPWLDNVAKLLITMELLIVFCLFLLVFLPEIARAFRWLMPMDKILSNIRESFQQTSSEKKNYTIAEYRQSFTLKKEEELPAHFYLWYYLKHRAAFTSLSIQYLPAKEEGPLANFEIIPIAVVNDDGATEPCEEEDEAAFWSLFVHTINDGRVLLADCSTKAIAMELGDELYKLLNPSESRLLQFTFSSLELTQAMTLVIYRFEQEKIIP